MVTDLEGMLHEACRCIKVDLKIKFLHWDPQHVYYNEKVEKGNTESSRVWQIERINNSNTK